MIWEAKKKKKNVSNLVSKYSKYALVLPHRLVVMQSWGKKNKKKKGRSSKLCPVLVQFCTKWALGFLSMDVYSVTNQNDFLLVNIFSRDLFTFTFLMYQLVMTPFSYHLPLEWVCDHMKLLIGKSDHKLSNYFCLFLFWNLYIKVTPVPMSTAVTQMF